MANQMREYFPDVTGTLLASIGYLDPGNWAASIESGSRFGYDLIWVVFLAKFTSWFLQYLSGRLRAATGKNLAQACRDEYPRGACSLLWLSSEVFDFSLDCASIIGAATGLNLLVGFPVLLGVLFAAAGSALSLTAARRFGSSFKAQLILGGFTALVILPFMITALTNGALYAGLVPRIRNESAYAATTLLGANVVPHFNAPRRKEHVVDTLLLLGTSLLLNLAMTVVAAAFLQNTGFAVLSLQDGFVLMEPFVGRTAAPIAFSLALLCTGLLCTIQRALSAGFSVSEDVQVERRALRAVVVVFATFYASAYSGNEGIYQLLLLSKAIVAFQLPFPLVLLIRLTSSAGYMGNNKISSVTEGLGWLLLLVLLLLNFGAVIGPLVTDTDEWGTLAPFEVASGSDWLGIKAGETLYTYGTVTMIIGTLSVGVLVWLTFTPMKADEAGDVSVLGAAQDSSIIAWKDKPAADTEAVELAAVDNKPLFDSFRGFSREAEGVGVGQIVEDGFSGDKDKKQAVKAVDTVAEECEVNILRAVKEEVEVEVPAAEAPEAFVDLASLLEKEQVVRDEDSPPGFISLVSEVSESSIELPHAVSDQNSGLDTVRTAEVGGDIEADKEVDMLEKEEQGWENLEQDDIVSEVLSAGLSAASPCEGPESGRSVKADCNESGLVGSGSGSLSRLSGLGRAARRQFAFCLDEFWTRLFDLHGQPAGPQSITMATTKAGSDRSPQSWTQDADGSYSLPKAATKRNQRSVIQPCPAPTEAYGRMYTHLAASTSQDHYARAFDYTNFGSSLNGERRYSSMRYNSHHADYEQQPATIHGYNFASYTNRAGSVGSPKARSLHLDVHPFGSRTSGSFPFQGAFSPQYSKSGSSFEGDCGITSGFNDNSFLGVYQENADDSLPLHNHNTERALTERFRSLEWNPPVTRGADKWNPLVYRATGELDAGRDRDSGLGYAPIGRGGSPNDSSVHSERPPLSFDEISPSQSHRDGFSIQAASQSESLWSKQPFELFAAPCRGTTRSAATSVVHQASKPASFTLPNGVEFGYDVFDHLRLCIRKLLQLEGSEWLFRLDNGCDEDVIAGVAAREKSLIDSEFAEPVDIVYSNGQMLTRLDGSGSCKPLVPGVPHCGDTCVWGGPLLISFGVWCVHRVLELSLMESRPELWGKYTYVLNRLQGILEPAFSRNRSVRAACVCLEGYQPVWNASKRGNRELESSYPFPWSWGKNTSNPSGKPASATLYLEMIKEVETAVNSRKGRTGTAAGDVAFPKGKENLASALKRYKRRLGNKPSGTSSTGNACRRSAAPSL